MREKIYSCAWWVWRAEKAYESVIDVIDKVIAGDEQSRGFYDSSFKRLMVTYDRVEKYCGLKVKNSRENVLDAKWHLDNKKGGPGGILDETPEMAAKWDLMFASSNLLDALKDAVKREGESLVV